MANYQARKVNGAEGSRHGLGWLTTVAKEINFLVREVYSSASSAR